MSLDSWLKEKGMTLEEALGPAPPNFVISVTRQRWSSLGGAKLDMTLPPFTESRLPTHKGIRHRQTWAHPIDANTQIVTSIIRFDPA